ncbi:MAG: hypothetical protein E4G91_00380 [Candidatus Zixiibacteriota bacterium]|nr:MAG: hypothetical protein E4G91_00380 [candidate division Zixibacteria bacterium]
MVFTGTSMDFTEEAFDQPDNPMSHPPDTAYTIADSAQLSSLRCMIINELQGTYSKYWMFSNDTGDYIHCVIKVATRHYRHFHVGLLTPLHPDLDVAAFYVTSQFWEQLDPTALSSQQSGSSPAANAEHDPYSTFHRNPFWASASGNETDGAGIQRMQFSPAWYHMPGIAENSPEIIWFKPQKGDALDVQTEQSMAIRTSVISSPNAKNVNAATDSVIFGIAHVSGSPDGLGSNLFRADRTFTSNAVPLIPLYVGANNTFAGAERLGVVAQIPDVFRINMRDIAAEQELTVGSDIYTCFPLINDDAVNVLAGEGYSGYEGLAYKKIDNGPVA